MSEEKKKKHWKTKFFFLSGPTLGNHAEVVVRGNKKIKWSDIVGGKKEKTLKNQVFFLVGPNFR